MLEIFDSQEVHMMFLIGRWLFSMIPDSFHLVALPSIEPWTPALDAFALALADSEGCA